MKKLLPAILLSALQLALFAQTTRTVLFEEFSGENCGPCAAINPALNDFIEQNSGQVILLKYQTNIPSAGILYNQNKVDVNSRKSYYTVNSAPWGRQDGKQYASSTNPHPYYYINTPSNLSNRAAIPSPFGVSVTHQFSDDGDSFYVSVVVSLAQQAFSSSATGKLKLRVAMVENLKFDAAPGTNGETEFHHVMRKMYPNATGSTLPDSWSIGTSNQYFFSGLIPAYIYDKTEINFIVFIQDDGTKEVHQAAISETQYLLNDATAKGIPASFYNCVPALNPSFVLANTGKTQLTSADIEVYLDNALENSIPWTGSVSPMATANVSLPSVSTTDGMHTLKVIVKNPNGVNDANIGKDTSTLYFAISPVPATAPLVEDFETGGSTGVVWQNPDADAARWTVVSTGKSSTKSYRMDFYNSPAGTIDYLYMPRLNLVGRSDANLSFDYAYAQYPYSNGNSSEELHIEFSKDCGQTWQSVYNKAGDALASVSPQTASFTPSSASQWNSETVSLTAAANNPDVLIRFKGVSQFGNNLYIDNVNVEQSGDVVSGIEETVLANLSVFPNPANDKLTVSYALPGQAVVTCEVVNAVGQKVFTSRAENVAGLNQFNIETRNFNSGIYYLNLLTEGQSITKKFTVNR